MLLKRKVTRQKSHRKKKLTLLKPINTTPESQKLKNLVLTFPLLTLQKIIKSPQKHLCQK